MTTANDLITRALRTIQFLGDTEVPSASQSSDGLVSFNAMLDSWSAGHGLTAYEIQEQSFALVIGTASYTIGIGGTINVYRPNSITQAYIRDSNNNNYGMRIVPRALWNSIGNRGSTITSQIPNTLFYDPQYPLGIINIFPTPLLAYTCYFDSELQQVTSAALTTSISMPPGYERAFVFNLGVDLANMMGFPIPAAGANQKNTVQLAEEALANIKRRNIQNNPQYAAYDSAIVSNSYATYNIYSDSFGRRGD